MEASGGSQTARARRWAVRQAPTGADRSCRLMAARQRRPAAAEHSKTEIHRIAHSGHPGSRGRTMIHTRRHAKALVSTSRHRRRENGGAPSEHHGSSIWKITAHHGKESRPPPTFLLVTALMGGGAPEGTRTPNLLIRSPKPGKGVTSEANVPKRTHPLALRPDGGLFVCAGRAMHSLTYRKERPSKWP
jgi:hypothetical protein